MTNVIAVRPMKVKIILKVCFEIETNRDGSVGALRCSAIAAVVILAASCDTTL